MTGRPMAISGSNVQLIHADTETDQNIAQSAVRNLSSVELSEYLSQWKKKVSEGTQNLARLEKQWWSGVTTSSVGACVGGGVGVGLSTDPPFLEETLPGSIVARAHYERQARKTLDGQGATLSPERVQRRRKEESRENSISPRKQSMASNSRPTLSPRMEKFKQRAQTARASRHGTGKSAISVERYQPGLTSPRHDSSLVKVPAPPSTSARKHNNNKVSAKYITEFKPQSSYKADFELRDELKKVAERFNNLKHHHQVRDQSLEEQGKKNPFEDGSIHHGFATEQRGSFRASLLSIEGQQGVGGGGPSSAVESAWKGSSSQTLSTAAAAEDPSATPRPGTAGGTSKKVDPTNWMFGRKTLAHRKEKSEDQKRKEADIEAAAVRRSQAEIEKEILRGKKKMMTPSERLIASSKAERAALSNYQQSIALVDSRQLGAEKTAPHSNNNNETTRTPLIVSPRRASLMERDVAVKPTDNYLGKAHQMDQPVVHAVSSVTRGKEQPSLVKGAAARHDFSEHSTVAKFQPSIMIETNSQAFNPRRPGQPHHVKPNNTIREGYIKLLGRRKPKVRETETNFPIF